MNSEIMKDTLSLISSSGSCTVRNNITLKRAGSLRLVIKAVSLFKKSCRTSKQGSYKKVIFQNMVSVSFLLSIFCRTCIMSARRTKHEVTTSENFSIVANWSKEDAACNRSRDLTVRLEAN